MTNNEIKEHDVVRLESGEIGSVVHIYPKGKFCEVELENNELKQTKLSELTKIK